jgi:hypothetical protein
MTSGNVLIQIARFFIVRDQRKDHWEKVLRAKYPNATQAQIEEEARAMAHEEYNPAAQGTAAVGAIRRFGVWRALRWIVFLIVLPVIVEDLFEGNPIMILLVMTWIVYRIILTIRRRFKSK